MTRPTRRAAPDQRPPQRTTLVVGLLAALAAPLLTGMVLVIMLVRKPEGSFQTPLPTQAAMLARPAPAEPSQTGPAPRPVATATPLGSLAFAPLTPTTVSPTGLAPTETAPAILTPTALPATADTSSVRATPSQASAPTETLSATAAPPATAAASVTPSVTATATPSFTAPASTAAASATPLAAATATSTVTATPRPLVFSGDRAFIDPARNTLRVVGELVNTTAVTQQIVRVTGVFYDAQGQVVADDRNVLDVFPQALVPAGGRVPFELQLDQAFTIARYELMVDSLPSLTPVRQDLTIANVAQRQDGSRYCVSGTVFNPGTRLTQTLVVVAVLKTAGDTVLDFGAYTLSRPLAVYGAQGLNFDICVPAAGGVTAAQAQAWGR